MYRPYNKENVDSHIINDRLRHFKIFEAIEIFIVENQMIVSGVNVFNAIRDDFSIKDVGVYEIYSNDSFNDAKALSDKIYAIDSNGLTKDTRIIHTVAYARLPIIVNDRIVAVIIKPYHNKAVNILRLMEQSVMEVEGLFIQANLRVSALYYMIDLYDKLINLDLMLEGIDIYKRPMCKIIQDNVLRKFVSENNKIRDFVQYNKKIDSTKLRALKTVIENIPDAVIVGDFAITLFNTHIHENMVLQITTAMPFNDIKRLFQRYKTTVKIYSPSIISSEIQKLCIFVLNRDDTTSVILEVYSNPLVSLIPFMTVDGDPVVQKLGVNEVNIGTLPVLLYFVFMDMWFISITKLTNKKKYKDRILKRLEAKVNLILRINATDLPIFPTDADCYTGQYLDSNIKSKREALKLYKKSKAYKKMHPFWTGSIREDTPPSAALSPATIALLNSIDISKPVTTPDLKSDIPISTVLSPDVLALVDSIKVTTPAESDLTSDEVPISTILSPDVLALVDSIKVTTPAESDLTSDHTSTADSMETSTSIAESDTYSHAMELLQPAPPISEPEVVVI